MEVLRHYDRVLSRLRDLYDMQAQQLQQRYRQSRAQYHGRVMQLLGVERLTPLMLAAVARHMPDVAGEHNSIEAELALDERTQYEEHRRSRRLHALARYGRRTGRDALFAAEARRRTEPKETVKDGEQVDNEQTPKEPPQKTCAFKAADVEDDSVSACANPVLPFSDYCATRE